MSSPFGVSPSATLKGRMCAEENPKFPPHHAAQHAAARLTSNPGRRPIDMPSADTVSLHAATAADDTLLANLLELYIHDLSAAFPDVALGPDGRFGYPPLPRYWAEPDRRFAYLIRAEGRVAGFVLATRGSPAAVDPDVYDVAEFFVLRRDRRAGVGRRAAGLLWRRHPGRWVVRVSEANTGGLAFWRGVVAEAAGGRVTESTRAGGAAPWRVLAFDTRLPGAAG
jgi:predicted acetyltransferase